MDCISLETVPPGTVHLDTVRALHQTVVSLRTALEVSKNELKELREKYEEHSNCLSFADVIEKLTLENHILRRKIIDSDVETHNYSDENINLEVTYSPNLQDSEKFNEEDIVHTDTSVCDKLEPGFDEFGSTEKLSSIEEVSLKDSYNPEVNDCVSDNLKIDSDDQNSIVASLINSSKPKEKYTSYKTKLELLSKFDVKIKVKALTEEGSFTSTTTSDSESTIDNTKNSKAENSHVKKEFNIDETKVHFDNFEDKLGNTINIKTVSSENITMAVPNESDPRAKTDKFDVEVRITSEENLIVKETVERNRNKDTLNLDVDNLSLRSLSEGDNSVFTEGAMTPVDQSANPDYKADDNVSENESEEVDDIELIFTTDESKDMSNLQEDLVSIRDNENWVPSSTSSTHSTPVLLKFHTLDPDFQPGTFQIVDNVDSEKQNNSCIQKEMSLRQKRVSLPNDRDIKHSLVMSGRGSLDLPGRGILKLHGKSDNMLYKKSPNASIRKLDCSDSITGDYNKGLSFDKTKSSSFELGSSMDILHRDDSVDSFYKSSHLGHRFSVFAETDISKCGISEEDFGNLNVRRNTCPNPFQYRPMPYRGTSRIGISRQPRIRSTRDSRGGGRRETGAQTEYTALPFKWSSDGSLAYKTPTPVIHTTPQRSSRGRLAVPSANRGPQTARRLMLSDIGFTSMVPELSRSAEPVWSALGKKYQPEAASNYTSKYISRGSSYRSPCLSIDRSNDWTPQNAYPRKASSRLWRSSLPDVRQDDTDELLEEADSYIRRSTDNLRSTSLDLESSFPQQGQPYIPAEPRHLRLGHTVKMITPQGRIGVGRVRYVGIAGGSAATSSFVVGAELPLGLAGGGARNDGTFRGRRYFLAQAHCTALFVPFAKVVMAWAN